jgi:hypothetical protein
MKHEQIASQICALVAEERYDDVLDLLPSYAEAVTEACLSEADFRQARDFLRAACKSVKSRRAHYVTQLAGLKGQQSYCGTRSPVRAIDVTG